MPGNGPPLLGMPDRELLDIIGVMCETTDNKPNEGRFDVHTRHATDSQNCRTNKDLQKRPDVNNTSADKTNIPDYLNYSTNKTHIPDNFHSNDNKEAYKRVSETITNRIHNEFNNLFSYTEAFEGTFSLQVKEGNHPYQTPQ